MLEGVAIELSVMVEVVWIGKKVVACAEHIATADIRTRQSYLFGAFDFEGVLVVAIQCFSHFVSQVGIGVFISNDSLL